VLLVYAPPVRTSGALLSVEDVTEESLLSLSGWILRRDVGAAHTRPAVWRLLGRLLAKVKPSRGVLRHTATRTMIQPNGQRVVFSVSVFDGARGKLQ
jgi:hypothetical protein